MSRYPVAELGDLAANEAGAIAIGPFGSRMKADIYVSDGVPVIRGTNIASGRGLKGNWVYVSPEFAQTIPNCLARQGDLVFPHRGSIGEVALIESEQAPLIISSSMMKFRPDKQKTDGRYILYYFKSTEGRNEILRFASQVGTPGIGQPLTSLRQFRVPLPSLAQQSAIADVLSVLDDKIELNRRMNETLEAMARAIFRDWFVTFGPTRAKQEGHAPYLAPDIWSLFPNRLDGDGKPEGWETKPLDQIAEFLNGIALQKYPAQGDPFLPVIKIAQLRAGNSDSSDKASPDIPASYVVENGDVLFSWSGSLLQRVWTAGLGALNQHLFKVTSDQYPKWFFFRWIEHHMPDFQATAASKATTMGHIQRHHLTQAMTVVADLAVMNAANEIIAPLFDLGIKNDIESNTLAATRDLLLPKLMSGEIRVKQTEFEPA